MSNDYTDIETLTLEKIRSGCAIAVDPQLIESLGIEHCGDFLGRELAHAVLKFYAPGRVTQETIVATTVPLTWWDALKEAHFPAWALRRWPARVRAIATLVKEYHVCPHIHFPEPQVHYKFLRGETRQ